MAEKQIVNAVFEGGGIRGIGIVGALSYLENHGYSWRKVAGASVGALIAALLSAGYTTKEMRLLLTETNFQRFQDKDKLQSIPLLGKPLSLITQNSLYSGRYLEEWLYLLLEKKGIVTFKDLCPDGNSPLKIIASDITRKCVLVLPDDLIKYNIDPSNFTIASAVRMSISIPFYFKPVKLKYKHGVSYIVDGCVCCNYPINIFDEEDAAEYPTFGFKFDDMKASYTSRGKTDPLSFLYDIASTMSNRSTVEYMSHKNKARSIIIPTANTSTTDFNISREKSLLLYKYGYRSAVEFEKNWNFDEYKKRYATS